MFRLRLSTDSLVVVPWFCNGTITHHSMLLQTIRESRPSWKPSSLNHLSILLSLLRTNHQEWKPLSEHLQLSGTTTEWEEDEEAGKEWKRSRPYHSHYHHDHGMAEYGDGGNNLSAIYENVQKRWPSISLGFITTSTEQNGFYSGRVLRSLSSGPVGNSFLVELLCDYPSYALSNFTRENIRAESGSPSLSQSSCVTANGSDPRHLLQPQWKLRRMKRTWWERGAVLWYLLRTLKKAFTTEQRLTGSLAGSRPMNWMLFLLVDAATASRNGQVSLCFTTWTSGEILEMYLLCTATNVPVGRNI